VIRTPAFCCALHSRFGVWPAGQHRRAVRDGRPPTPRDPIPIPPLDRKAKTNLG
jgi:hypothetical protein